MTCLEVLTLKLGTTPFEHLYLRTFSFRAQFNTESLFLCSYTSAQDEKAATCGRHLDVNILSGRVMFCLLYNIWRSCTGLFFLLSEINVLLVFFLLVLISRGTLFLHEGIFFATSKMCVMLTPTSLSCINELCVYLCQNAQT